MQLAVQTDLVEHLAAVRLEAAVVIVQPHAGDSSDQAVEDSTRERLVPRVMTNRLPPADDVVPLGDRRQKARDLLRMILEIGVERQHDLARCFAETGGQRRRLAEIASQADRRHPRIARRQRLDRFPAPIGRAVVDQNDLEFDAVRRSRLAQLPMEGHQTLRLIEDRNHGRALHGPFPGRARGEIDGARSAMRSAVAWPFRRHSDDQPAPDEHSAREAAPRSERCEISSPVLDRTATIAVTACPLPRP